MPSLIEPLEARIAPATLLSPTTVTYQDADGDNVTVKITKPLFDAATINQVFTWNTGSTIGTEANPDNGTKQQLYKMDVTALAADATGVSISITTTGRTPNGADGSVSVGYLNADGIDLGAVTIEGDLGKLIAGANTPKKSGVKSLAVQSMGVDGASGAPDLSTLILGGLGSLKVKGDVRGASVSALDAGMGNVTIGGRLFGTVAFSGYISSDSGMGSVTVGGDVHGDQASSGYISSVGPMGRVKIVGDLEGGSGDHSGAIHSGATIAGVTIGGELRGSGGAHSGSVEANVSIGPVSIGASIVGGPGNGSGFLYSGGKMGSVTIGGSLIGGTAPGFGSANLILGSGEIFSLGEMGAVKIKHDIQGNSGNFSGSLLCFAKQAGVSVGGSLTGSTGSGSGSLVGVDLRMVKIGGNLDRGTGPDAGQIVGGRISSITIGGSLSGSVGASKDIGSVIVKGSILGTAANPVVIAAASSPEFTATRDVVIKTLTVTGSVSFAEIRAGYDNNNQFVNPNAQIGSITVGGNWDHNRLSAGAEPGPDGIPGTKDDILNGTISQIASIVIKGFATGGGDSFFIDAGKIGSLSVHAVKAPLTAGPDNFNFNGSLPVRDLR